MRVIDTRFFYAGYWWNRIGGNSGDMVTHNDR